MSTRIGHLLRKSAAGDVEAFADLYRTTSPRIYGLVLRLLRSADHAAEVTQEVYLEVWGQAARHDPTKGSGLTWMTTIAHRRAVDRIRAVTATTARDQNYAARTCPIDIDSVWDSVTCRADATRVRGALATLSPRQREALLLAYFYGHTQSQIAALLHLPLGTVKTRIRNGLITLRKAIQPD